MKTLYECIVETLGDPKDHRPGLYDFCRTISRLVEKVPVDPLLDLFGETYQDQPRKPESHLRGGGGWFSDNIKLADVSGYLCYDNRGDYVSFTHKPTNSQLDKAKDYIEKEFKKLLSSSDKKLWDEFGTVVKVFVNPYNKNYQPQGTYGIGFIFSFRARS